MRLSAVQANSGGALMSLDNETFEAARRNGAAPVIVNGETFYLVAPQSHLKGPAVLFKDTGRLLDPPTARSAYSDRTAWLMACCAKLAYIPFEKETSEMANLVASLAGASLQLLATFDASDTGTQAFLALRNADEEKNQLGFLILAFRGTEKNRKDILVDLNARFYATADGQAHRGFWTAFESVRQHISDTLHQIRIKAEQNGDEDIPPLYITGHSLGGALAIAATQILEEEYLVASCYCYGAPRVGTAEWSDCVKTPIYRVVNGADGVPMVPGSNASRALLTLLPNIPLFAWSRGMIENFIKKGFVGFQHAGDFRFVNGEIEVATLQVGSAAVWARLRYVAVSKAFAAIWSLSPRFLSSTFKDHAIDLYVAKLRRIAEARNP